MQCPRARNVIGQAVGALHPGHHDPNHSQAELRPAQIDGSEERDISLTLGGQVRNFKGENYLTGFLLPNFFFHTTTAYAILRHNGVELGKGDFMRAPG